MSNFDGRLFGGRLFAGQLFGRRRNQTPPSGPDAPLRAEPRRRTEFTNNELMDIAIAIIFSGALDG